MLVVLGGAGPSSIKELAGTLRLDHATLTPILRRMEEAGLLTRDRDPGDARVVRLALMMPSESTTRSRRSSAESARTSA